MRRNDRREINTSTSTPYTRPRRRGPEPSPAIHEYNYPLYRRREIPNYGVLRISMGCWVPLCMQRLSDVAEEIAVPYLRPQFATIIAYPRQQDAWDFLSAQTGHHFRMEVM